MAGKSTKSVALGVVRKLLSAGYEAYFAGGCVRDMLLGRRPGDYDIATDASPGQIKSLFRRVLMVGARFGVAVVLKGDQQVEVATFRSDVSYSDGRRPDSVRFSSPAEDALRRDFTINGMFYDPLSDEVIDYVGGRDDLAAGIVRTIGVPAERFAEDYLRMLRGPRFAIRLGFDLDGATAREIARKSANITSISGERIFDELSKMLSGPAPAMALEMLDELGLASEILPELFDVEAPGLWERAVGRVQQGGKYRQKYLALTCLLAELGVGAIRKIVRRWGGSNELREAVSWVSTHLDKFSDASEMSLADFKRLIANDNFGLLRRLWQIHERMLTGKITAGRSISRRINGIDPASIDPPALVTGEDLKALGLAESPALGRILKILRDGQLNETLLTRSSAMKEAKRLAQVNPERK